MPVLEKMYFRIKGWTRWSFAVPSNLGCSTVLWFYKFTLLL